MASVFKRSSQSKYWYADYTGATGERVKKSTKLTDRKKAMSQAVDWERAANQIRQGRLSEAQIQEVVADMYERATGKRPNVQTWAEWTAEWVARQKAARAEATAEKYRSICESFGELVGTRPIHTITTADIKQWRDKMDAEGLAGSTCNDKVNVISLALGAAMREGKLLRNPASVLEPLPVTKVKKGVFTPAQISKLLNEAKGDMMPFVLFGITTGARLSDVAALQWRNLDRFKRLVSYLPAKTGRRVPKEVVVPWHPLLASWLDSTTWGELGDPIMPRLAKITPQARSQAFTALLDAVGIVPEKTLPKKGAAEKGKGRAVSSLTFHSLRHTLNSALANAGVSQEIRQGIVGHASAAMNDHYTQLDVETIRAAVKLADVG